jgi:hypothetical protein
MAGSIRHAPAIGTLPPYRLFYGIFVTDQDLPAFFENYLDFLCAGNA